MNKTGFLVVGILVLGVVLWSFVSQDEAIPMDENFSAEETYESSVDKSLATDTAKVKSSSTTKPVEKKEMHIYPRLQARLDVMEQRRPDVEFDPAEVDAAMSRESAWEPKAEVPTNLPLTQEELTDGRKFIEFDSMKIETLMPGDQVSIAIDEDNRTYQMVVESVENHDYETISWKGHLDVGDGENYRVSFTRGKDLTVGGIDTPEGNYVVQAHGNTGWIASSGLLYKEHTDPIIPQEEE